MERPQPHPLHRRGTFLRWLQPLYTKKQGFVFLLPPQNITHATFTQPFQCDLQPQLPEPHRTTHRGTTDRCNTHRRNNSRMKRPQPHPPHRRGTFHRRLQPLCTEDTPFRAPASSPKHDPCSIHAAIPMRSCNQRFKNRIKLRTQEQPLVARHIGRTICAWSDRSRIRCTDGVLRWLQPLYTEKQRLRVPASSPKHNPCNIHAAIPMRSCNQRFKNRIKLRTQEQPLVAKHIGGTICA